MKLLVIGSGGREHALAWKLLCSPRVSRVFVAPGNAGTALEEAMDNVAADTIPELIAFAQREEVALTVVGPEAPLAEGIVDAFQAAGLRIFGPTQRAARLESSKDFAKTFMVRHGIPTAAYATFDDAGAAHAHIDRQGAPTVIKADGLAAGKGVVVARSVAEAHEAIDRLGGKLVIEECLAGEEASFIVLADGAHALALATSQDHKRLRDGDAGPNTGGMGAYSPPPMITPAVERAILDRIVEPTLRGMREGGTPLRGALFVGLMLVDGEITFASSHDASRLRDPAIARLRKRIAGSGRRIHLRVYNNALGENFALAGALLSFSVADERD